MPTLAATDRLYAEHVNPQWVLLLDVLQMNVPYLHSEGADLFRADGQRGTGFPVRLLRPQYLAQPPFGRIGT